MGAINLGSFKVLKIEISKVFKASLHKFKSVNLGKNLCYRYGQFGSLRKSRTALCLFLAISERTVKANSLTADVPVRAQFECLDLAVTMKLSFTHIFLQEEKHYLSHQATWTLRSLGLKKLQR